MVGAVPQQDADTADPALGGGGGVFPDPPEGRQAQLEGYAEVRALLGDTGASAKAGSLMMDYLLK